MSTTAPKHTASEGALWAFQRLLIAENPDDPDWYEGILGDAIDELGADLPRLCRSHNAVVDALKACMIRLVQVDERFRKWTGAEPAGELGEITRAKAALKLLES